MPKPPVWIHCNVCSERQAKSWHISSCRKIICQNCLPRLKMTHCRDCKGACTKTIELNSRAPKDVKRLFGDVGEEIRKFSKIIDFQDKHKAKFLLAFKIRIAKLDEIHSERTELERNKLAKIEEVKKRLEAKQEEVRQKKFMLKSIEDERKPWFNTSTPAYKRTCNNWLDTHLETWEVWPCPRVKRRRDDGADRRIAGQDGRNSPEEPFLKLATPAAWYGGQGHGGKRQRKEAEAAKEDRMEEVIKSPVVRSLGKMFDSEEDRRPERIKSPVVRALDKLLEEDSPAKVIEKDAKSKISTFSFDPVKFFKSLYGAKQ